MRNVATTEIPFTDLYNSEKYDDSNSFVWMALIPPAAAEVEDVEKFLRDGPDGPGFLPKGIKILGMHKIAGNVKGDDGRTDVLFVTQKTSFNPIARLRIEGLKWTSDFIANYAGDYGQSPEEISSEEDDFE